MLGVDVERGMLGENVRRMLGKGGMLRRLKTEYFFLGREVCFEEKKVGRGKVFGRKLRIE